MHGKIGTIRTAAQLLAAGMIDDADLEVISRVSSEFAVAITPHLAELIEAEAGPASGPLAAQFIPRAAELTVTPGERRDPIGDAAHSPLPGIIHRYPDRVLLTPLHVCPAYCRFCFRREAVGPGMHTLDEEALAAALAYIEDHEDIWEVIISGGDPLIMSPRRIARIMRSMQEIDHVRVVRLHTRVPVIQPDAVDEELLRALRIDKAVYVILHTNHADELSAAARKAIARLIDSGVPMLSQTVLLKGVNADAGTLKTLFRSLVEIRVKPYYLHHGDLAKGTQHFRTTIGEGQAVVAALRGHLSGLCQPLYVLDIPGGHGKVPIGPGYLTELAAGKYSVCDYRGSRHSYEEPAPQP